MTLLKAISEVNPYKLLLNGAEVDVPMLTQHFGHCETDIEYHTSTVCDEVGAEEVKSEVTTPEYLRVHTGLTQVPMTLAVLFF